MLNLHDPGQLKLGQQQGNTSNSNTFSDVLEATQGDPSEKTDL